MRLSTHLRMALHDWMWGVHLGPIHRDEPNLAQRLARRLPLYFSDPEACDLRDFFRSGRFDEVAQPTVGPKAVIVNGSEPRTWSSGTFTNLTITYPPGFDNPYA